MKPSVRQIVLVGLASAAVLTGSSCGGSSPTSPSPPTGPSLAAPGIDTPADGAEVATTRPTLTVINVFNPPAGSRTYEFQVSTSTAFTPLIVNQVGVAEGESRTSFTLTTDLAAETRYYWRARAVQSGTAGPWSTTPSFRVVKGQGPVVKQLSAKGARTNQPLNFGDLGETLTVTAVVEDPDTAADKLIYSWRANAGSVSGTGPSMSWQAPTGINTPATATITLTVSDAASGTGNSTTSTLTINVHDSPREIGEMALQFLRDFSTQAAPETVMRNFTSSCPGRAAELADVVRNQRCFTINSYTLGTPAVTVSFDGVCPFRGRPADACTSVAVDWRSTTKSAEADCGGGAIGTRITSVGTDWVTAIYERERWWLCDSDFDGKTTSGALFKR